MSIREIKQILDQPIDFESPLVKNAMIKLGFTQRSLQRVNYLEYMTTNNQQDYFLYLQAIASNIKRLNQEIAKLQLIDKSIDCGEPDNIEEIVALLDKRMKEKQRTKNISVIQLRQTTLQNTQNYDSYSKPRIIRYTKQGSMTERKLPSPLKMKLIVSNNQSIQELSYKVQPQPSNQIYQSTLPINQINDIIPKQQKIIISGIKHKLQENNCSKQAIDGFIQKVNKMRSLSQQSIDSGNRKISGINIMVKKQSNNIIQNKLQLMLQKEKLISEEPLKINKLSVLGVISKIRNKRSKQMMFQYLQ